MKIFSTSSTPASCARVDLACATSARAAPGARRRGSAARPPRGSPGACRRCPTARWSFVPRIAAEIEAVTSPSWISLIRAPAARISSIRSWWRGRSRTIVVMSLGVRPKASAIARDVVGQRAAEVDPAAGGRADGHLAHVHVGQRLDRVGLADDHHRHRAVAAARDDRAAPLERDEREVDRPAAAADRRLRRRRPRRGEHELAVDRQLLERPRHRRRRRRSCAASWSPRPSQRAPASAAASVARAVGRAEAVAAVPARLPLRGALGRGPAHAGSVRRSPGRAPSRCRSRPRRRRSRRPARRACSARATMSFWIRRISGKRRRTCRPLGCRARRRRGTRSASGARPRPRSRARTARRRAPSICAGTSPGTRWTPSSTIDQPSCSARSSAARTPTRTLRVCSRNPAIAGSAASSGARSAAAASKLE